MIKRNRKEFSMLVNTAKPKIIALLTAKGPMKPIRIREELLLDETLCRASLESLCNDGELDPGRYYKLKHDTLAVALPDPVPTVEPVPQDDLPAEVSEESLQELVRIEKGALITDSMILAKMFGKDHKNVLRAIENLDCTPRFNRLNFEPVNYLDSKGESRPYIKLTRDGFVFAAMGFTGQEAAIWKERFIEAFNAMEAELLRRTTVLPDGNSFQEGLMVALKDITRQLKENGEWATEQREKSLIAFSKIHKIDVKIDEVDCKVTRLGYRTAEVEKGLHLLAKRGRKNISQKVKERHLKAVISLGCNCPCCGTVEIINAVTGMFKNAEGDHFYQNSLADHAHTWWICVPCHDLLTRGLVSRASREPEFKAYQNKMDRLPGIQTDFNV